jgi:solute carrier family 25 (adenine nucleotide translocator) protein 4/5/6/31
VYRGVFFGLYDTAQVYRTSTTFASKFALGYVVTVLAEFLAYPFDTVRRRLMMTSGGERVRLV